MTRQAKGSGSVSLRSPGVYRLRVYVGRDPVTNKARYASKDVPAKNITAARKALAGFVTESRARKVDSNATMETVMAEYVRSLEANSASPRTITEARRTIDRVIVPSLGQVPVNELTARHIDVMLQGCTGSDSTKRRYHAVLSAALGLAVRWEWIDVNPASRATLAKRDQAIIIPPTREEVTRLIDAMPAEVWRVALKLAVLTGMRRGELCALKWADISGGVIRVRRSAYRDKGETKEKTTKANRERWIPLDPVTDSVLDRWGRHGVYVLSSWPDRSRALNPDTLSAHVTRAAKDLGIRHVHLHSLRHFAITEMLAQGIGVRDVAEVAGHADGGRLALQVYGHATDERQKAAAAAMAKSLVSGSP